MRALLLGSDLKNDCTGTGAALGLNDLIHCITLEKGAVPVDVLPAFDAAGTAWIAGDGIHPDDAGHLAIAQAFGGAADPTLPPPPPPPACVVPNVKGKTLHGARTGLVAAHCRLGKVASVFSGVKTGRVISQSPRAGKHLKRLAKVNVVLSRGHRH